MMQLIKKPVTAELGECSCLLIGPYGLLLLLDQHAMSPNWNTETSWREQGQVEGV